jgi:predicted transcriptional regulator
VIEHLVALHAELRRQRAKPTATPEEARAANADLRAMMRERGNYFPEIEDEAASALATVGYTGGALSQGMLLSVVSHHGFSVRYVRDLPRTVRSVTDLRNRRIYLKQESMGMHTPRTILLQTLGHFVLGHSAPQDFADFLHQRVEANYFAAAVLVPQGQATAFLREAADAKSLSVEDLRDVFSVSYEMAAHRFTNLATHHLGLPCHFVKNDEGGIIYKAYENDGVVFPADATGAIEGQRMCRQWSGRQVFAADDRFSPHYQYSDTPAGTYYCVAQVDQGGVDRGTDYAITLGVTFDDARWFRGRDTTKRTSSSCPDPACCQRRPAWRRAGTAWPGLRLAPTRTSCRRCRPAASPAWTKPTSTRSSNGTSTSNLVRCLATTGLRRPDRASFSRSEGKSAECLAVGFATSSTPIGLTSPG